MRVFSTHPQFCFHTKVRGEELFCADYRLILAIVSWLLTVQLTVKSINKKCQHFSFSEKLVMDLVLTLRHIGKDINVVQIKIKIHYCVYQ
mgnify:CR=1 FL=1